MKELIILTKSKELYFNIDKISINIPKKYKFEKDQLKIETLSLISNIIEINNNTNKELLTYYEKEIRKSINIIDFLIEYGLTNKFISYLLTN